MRPFPILAVLLLVAACAQTSVQPMARDTFKVDTQAAPACGPQGARTVAFRTAAIEVIRRGHDKFVIVKDTSQSLYGGHGQGMVVKVIPEGSPRAGNALSARTTLGPDWRQMVAEGAPQTCT